MKITTHLTDEAILAELGKRLARHRLNRQLTQAHLAREAGISKRTVERIEAGNSTQLSSFLRLCRALGLLDSIATLIPEAEPSPIDLLRSRGKERQRAYPRPQGNDDMIREGPSEWKWGDES